jgi:hypothetical protein
MAHGRIDGPRIAYLWVGCVYVLDKARVALSCEFAVERLVVPGMMIHRYLHPIPEADANTYIRHILSARNNALICKL